MRAPAILLAAAAAIAPGSAWAELPSAREVPPKARTLADRGRELHDRGDYASAIAAFTQAYAMAPSPPLLFNLAQAFRLQGNCDDAAVMYRRYLASRPAPAGRAMAERHLENVERCVHERARRVAARRRVPSSLTALGADTRRAGSVPSERVEQDIGVGLAIGGGVSLLVAAYYTVQAHEAADDVAAAYARGAKWKDVAPIDARGKSAARTAQVFGAGGALAIGGGIVTYLLSRRSERAPVTVAPTRRGVEVSKAWRF